MNRIKDALRVVVEYLRENPGAATTIAGWVVLGVARLGLHVTVEQLASIAVILVPLISGTHVAARRSRRKAAAK